MAITYTPQDASRTPLPPDVSLCISLEQQRQGQRRQAALATTIEEFCRNISAALNNLSFETKQKILRPVVERVEFIESQITIKHVIAISSASFPAGRYSHSVVLKHELKFIYDYKSG